MVDAVKTYEFTWAIRKATEESRAARLKAQAEAEAALALAAQAESK